MDEIDETIKYTDYIAENLEKSIAYSEYIAENLDKSIEFSNYICGEIDKNIKYSDYLGISDEEEERRNREKIRKNRNKHIDQLLK